VALLPQASPPGSQADASRCALFVDGARADSQTHTGDMREAPMLFGASWLGELDEARMLAHSSAGVGRP
jgi:hypothetical protein